MKSRINNDEREISLIELWWYTLSKWKALIIGFGIGALLLSGLGYYKSYSDASNSAKRHEAMINKTADEILGGFTDKERRQIEIAADLYDRYIEEYNNIDLNYVMTLDADKVDKALLQYMVDINYIIDYNGKTIENYTNDILKMYVSSVRTQEFKEEVMKLGIDNLEEKDIDFLINASYNGNILEFSIFGHGDDCVKIAEIIKNNIDNSFVYISQGIGEHEIELLNENNTQVYSATIKSSQTTKRSDLKVMKENSDAIVEKMSAKQIAAYNTLKYKIDSGSTDKKFETPTYDIKTALIGGFIGLIIVLAFIIVTFMFGRKLHSINDVEQVYNVCLLGKIIQKNSTKIKKVIDKRRVQINCKQNTDEQIDYVVNTIVSKCKNEALEELYIAYDKSVNIETVDAMNKQIKALGMQVKSGVHVTEKTEALQNATKCKNIVFVEKLDSSERDIIAEEVQICDRLNINIIGLVITV